MHQPKVASACNVHQAAACITLRSTHLAIQLHIPELWVHAKRCAMQITVQVVPALPHALIDSSLLARVEARSIHVFLEQAAVVVYLQQYASICTPAIGRHDVEQGDVSTVNVSDQWNGEQPLSWYQRFFSGQLDARAHVGVDGQTRVTEKPRPPPLVIATPSSSAARRM